MQYWLLKSEPEAWSWSMQVKEKLLCGMVYVIIKLEII